ncbi:MAG: dihydrofolate reductase [Chryseobacterium sp.]|nr:MAG: dihydrofolate reductase [Chryseobacterium sp.]
MITIIAAIGKNNALGKDNQLLWRLPKDLKHFKIMTENHPIVMGRKTYESIGKPLPNRTNIVVSRKENWFSEEILIVSKLKEAVKFAKKIDEEVFIIGGGEIYNQTMELADRLVITYVDQDFEADTFFPKIDLKIWQKTDEEFHPKDEQNDHDFYFQTYEKIIKD